MCRGSRYGIGSGQNSPTAATDRFRMGQPRDDPVYRVRFLFCLCVVRQFLAVVKKVKKGSPVTVARRNFLGAVCF